MKLTLHTILTMMVTKYIGVPEVQFVGGLYLKSKFFDDNLNLKSGFTFYYTGKRSSYSEEWGFVEVEPIKQT